MQNETLTHFLSTQPSHRDRRPARGLAALAFFTVVMGAIIDTPMHSYYTSPSSLYAPPGIPPASAFTVRSIDEPFTPSTNKPAFSAKTAKAFLKQNNKSESYAFVTIALPSGSTPTKLDQAFASVDAKHWRFATDLEVDQLNKAFTWDLVSRTDAPNVISGKWIFKIKKNADGTVDRYKARWVARGFSQKHGIDFTEVFAPTIRYSSIRLLLALANHFDLDLYGLDISNAFARADVDEDLFVEQPHGYVQRDKSGKPYVCKLRKGLYGTKQAARLWHQKFRAFLLSHGWKPYDSDPCIFSRHTKQFGHEFLGIYVDDIIHVSKSLAAHTAFHKSCNANFPTTSQGPLHWILGMHIKRDRDSRTLCIHQTQAIISFLEEWDALTPQSVRSTPLDAAWRYGDDPATTDDAAILEYRSKVGSMNFYSQCTRPDISYAVGILCRHLHNPNKNCFRALSQVMSYLAHTPHLGLVYHSNNKSRLTLETYTDAPQLEAYSDASYGGEDIDSAKSTTGLLIYFAGALVAWASALQPTIALSSADAEHVAAYETGRYILYFRQFLTELGLTQSSPTRIWEDNTACIAQSKNPVNHKRSKHMLIKYHYLRDLVDNSQISLEYVNTNDQVADILTKPLPNHIFSRLLFHIVRPAPPSCTSHLR